MILKRFENFELKHKLFIFLSTIFLMILVTRLLVLIKDPEIIIHGYLLHHFYYGVILLVFTSIFMLFNKKHYLICLVLSGISIGLILDEFIFILGQMSKAQYMSTLPSAIIFFLIIFLVAGIIKKLSNQKKFSL